MLSFSTHCGISDTAESDKIARLKIDEGEIKTDTLPLYSLFGGKPKVLIEKYLCEEEREVAFPQINKCAKEINLCRNEKLLNIPSF